MVEGEMAPGEMVRNLARHDREIEAIRASITKLAGESVTVTQFSHEMGSLRRELAADRAQQEELARERHKTTLDRLDRMEVTERSRGMNTVTKVGVFGSLSVGLLGILATIILAIVHH